MIGNNLLKRTLKLVGTQAADYYRNTGRTTNTIGLDVAAFDLPVVIQVSIQPVPRTVYQQLGLDLQRNYVTVYTTQNVLDLQRDFSGDQVRFAGKVYQLVSSTNWQAVDGWQSVLCVEVA